MFRKFSAVLVMVLVAVGLVIAVGATSAQEPTLVGTWKVTIPGEGDVPGFQALQTFHADGTFTETSSLLGAREEGPAHGVWSQDGDHYNLLFQLFAFDKESGDSTGMIQVKLQIKLVDADNWISECGTVHFIAPDGTMELLDEGCDGPGNEATRLKVEPV
jgi:hypothetical protein